MADDMANGAPARTYETAAEAALGERVTNLGRRQSDFEQEMRASVRTLDGAISSLATETRNAFAALQQSLGERSRVQWPAISVALVFAGMVGALAYWPIREQTTTLRDDLTTLANIAITRAEMDWRTERSKEDRARAEQSIADIRAGLVPRLELDRVFHGYDQRFAEQQRQIDEAKATLGSTYSLRDYIQRLTERLDRLEERRGTAYQGG